MGLSKEEIELRDPNVPWRRKLRLRARRMRKYLIGTLVAFVATCLLVLVAGFIYFGSAWGILSLE